MSKYLILLALLVNIASAKTMQILLTEDNSIIFNQAVTEEYASRKALEVMIKAERHSPLYLVLDTPGGSVLSGLKFIDSLKSLKVPIHTITLFAASMGYQFVQELGTRYITPSGTLMSHRGAVSNMSGQIPGELTSRINHIYRILDNMSLTASKRIGLDKKNYDNLIINELWSYGVKAVETRQADFVANVRCDKSLIEGSYQEEVITLFGKVTLKFSKCPLISYPVGVQFGSNVKQSDFKRVMETIKQDRRNPVLTF